MYHAAFAHPPSLATCRYPAEVEDAARRRAQREASDANRCIAQRRTMAEAAHKAAEQKALRHTMLAEVRGQGTTELLAGMHSQPACLKCCTRRSSHSGGAKSHAPPSP